MSRRVIIDFRRLKGEEFRQDRHTEVNRFSYIVYYQDKTQIWGSLGCADMKKPLGDGERILVLIRQDDLQYSGTPCLE